MGEINYLGNAFKSHAELAKHLGIDRSTLRKRIKNKWPQENWGLKKGSKVVYKGKKFESHTSLAKSLGISQSLLTSRINAGWPEDAWTNLPGEGCKPFGNSKSIEYQGSFFDSIKELAEFLGISTDTLSSRINQNYPQEEWGILKRAIPIKYMGENYPSIKALSLHLEIPYSRLIDRINAGWHEDTWLNPVGIGNSSPAEKAITYCGEPFFTIKSLAEYLNINSRLLGDRIRSDWPEKYWSNPVGEAPPNKLNEIKFKNKIFKSKKDLAEYLGISSGVLNYRIKSNWPEETWGKKPDNTDISTGIKVSYQGKLFRSIKSLSIHLSVPYIALSRRIARGDPENTWAKQSRRRGEITYQNIIYSTRYDLAKYLSNKYPQSIGTIHKKLRQALDVAQLDIDMAVDYAITNDNSLPIDFRGKTYPTLTSLAEYLNIHLVTLRERIIKGWPESFWDQEKLPTASPDFYYFLNNPYSEKGHCSFYIVEMDRFKGFYKLGIAKSLSHRRDREYGDEVINLPFGTRFEALVFEQSILNETMIFSNYPKELDDDYPERWHGITEIRQLDQSFIEKMTIDLIEILDEKGLYTFGEMFIPMSEDQLQNFSKCINTI